MYSRTCTYCIQGRSFTVQGFHVIALHDAFFKTASIIPGVTLSQNMAGSGRMSNDFTGV